MQPMRMMPMSQQPEPLGYEQQAYCRGWYHNMKGQNEQMQQEQQSTHALYSTGSQALHQAHEQHQERTGEETELNVQYMHRREPRTYGEWNHNYMQGRPPRNVREWKHDSFDYRSDEQDDRADEDIGDIGACRAVE